MRSQMRSSQTEKKNTKKSSGTNSSFFFVPALQKLSHLQGNLEENKKRQHKNPRWNMCCVLAIMPHSTVWQQAWLKGWAYGRRIRQPWRSVGWRRSSGVVCMEVGEDQRAKVKEFVKAPTLAEERICCYLCHFFFFFVHKGEQRVWTHTHTHPSTHMSTLLDDDVPTVAALCLSIK